MVAKITRSAIHHAQAASVQQNTSTTKSSMNKMKKILPAKRKIHNHSLMIISRLFLQIIITVPLKFLATLYSTVNIHKIPTLQVLMFDVLCSRPGPNIPLNLPIIQIINYYSSLIYPIIQEKVTFKKS